MVGFAPNPRFSRVSAERSSNSRRVASQCVYFPILIPAISPTANGRSSPRSSHLPSSVVVP
jgi:hypothetical protein